MKFMNMKRFGSVAMAGALALSLAAPAFAANTTVIEGGYEEIPIAVLVPETGTAQINPYGLPVTIEKSNGTVNIVDQQITSVPLSIRNQGTVPLDVGASLKVAPRGELEIKPTYAASTDKGKQAKVTLEVAGLNDDALKVSLEAESIEDMLIDKFVSDATWTGAGTLNAPAATAATAESVTAAKSTDGTPLVTLGATTTATVSGETQVVYGAKSIALFRLAGTLNAAPNDGATTDPKDTPWTAEDGFTATVVFNFKPAAKTNVTVTATGSTSAPTSVKGYEGDTITFTVEGATGKTLTGTLSGMDGTAPTVTCTETPASSGKYTISFTMPADDTTAGMALAITGF